MIWKHRFDVKRDSSADNHDRNSTWREYADGYCDERACLLISASLILVDMVPRQKQNH